MVPASTTRQERRSSLRNSGNSVITLLIQTATAESLTLDSMRHAARRRITSHGWDNLPGKKLPQLGVAMAREQLAEILGRTFHQQVMLQQSLDRVRNFRCEATVAHRTSDRLMESDRSTEAEIGGVQQAVSGF